MLETNHHEKLSDVAVVTLEKLMKNELEEEMNEDVRVVSVELSNNVSTQTVQLACLLKF